MEAREVIATHVTDGSAAVEQTTLEQRTRERGVEVRRNRVQRDTPNRRECVGRSGDHEGLELVRPRPANGVGDGGQSQRGVAVLV
jgi:hypothetical protein